MTQHLLESLYALAVRAGDAIMAIYEQPIAVEYKDDHSPLTAADRAAHAVIAEGLSELAPEIPVLSEEGRAIAWDVRSRWERFFLVDPLDGTKEFIKRNGEFTVNIALIEQGMAVAGVVYAPALRVGYAGDVNDGYAWKQEGELRSAIRIGDVHSPWQIVGSRSHQSPEMVAFAQRLPAHEMVAMGSSLKICLVAEGRADLYPRLGPTMAWDTGAAHAVLTAAGGELVSVENGMPLLYNQQESLLNPYFLAGSPKALAQLV